MNYSKRSTRSNLTASDVLDIRRLHDVEGLNDAELSRRYSVSRKAIYNIVNRKSWSDVPDPVSLRGYTSYSVYPDGRVFSNSTGKFLSPIGRVSGPAVKMISNTGVRRTMPVRSLVQRGFGS